MATYIVSESLSRIDGAPIVTIASGIGPRKADRSKNPKTGPMVQVWFLCRDQSPIAAISDGTDRSICGTCKLRGLLVPHFDGTLRNRSRSCYVDVANAPSQIWNAYQAGKYSFLPEDLIWPDQATRLGAYGDPCTVSVRLLADIVRRGHGHTGYTHAWRLRRFQPHRRFLMASCETLTDVNQAHAMGWRTFRSMPDVSDLDLSREILCPASEEAGKRRTCEKCKACNGSGTGRSIAIVAHGSPAKLASYRKLFSD